MTQAEEIVGPSLRAYRLATPLLASLVYKINCSLLAERANNQDKNIIRWNIYDDKYW